MSLARAESQRKEIKMEFFSIQTRFKGGFAIEEIDEYCTPRVIETSKGSLPALRFFFSAISLLNLCVAPGRWMQWP